MEFRKICAYAVFFASIIVSISGDKSSESSEESVEYSDPTVGGKWNNPGARIRFGPAALDAIYDHAVSRIAEKLKASNIPEMPILFEGAILTIKSSKITDAKISNHSRELLPPNEIRSSLLCGDITSEGQWYFKPYVASRSYFGNGLFRTRVVSAELNMTSTLDRTADGHPMVRTQSCKAYLGEFRVEIEGFGNNDSKPHVIENCDNAMCKHILDFFEKTVCNAAKQYVSEYVNEKLLSFPTRINVGPVGNHFIMDNRLLNNDPVAEHCIRGDLEGEVISRTGVAANFHAVPLAHFDMGEKAVSFTMSDYAFNTLFYQFHQQQIPFSAYDLLANNSAEWKSLSLNCSTFSPALPPSPAVRLHHRELKATSTRKTTTKRTTTKRTTTKKTTTPKPTTTPKTTTSKSTSTSAIRKSASPAAHRPSSQRVYVNSAGVGSSIKRFHGRRCIGWSCEKPTVGGGPKCLGGIFDNETSGMGNLIFKTHRPLQVVVNDPSEKSYFSTRGGTIEIYEADDHLEKEKPKSAKLLLRAGVKSMSGDFFPKMKDGNITGSVEVRKLELSQPQPVSPLRLADGTVSDQVLTKLSEFAKPILTAMINAFLELYAQFPVPLMDGYECLQPEFQFSNRTMNINCDIRVLANAIRKGPKRLKLN